MFKMKVLTNNEKIVRCHCGQIFFTDLPQKGLVCANAEGKSGPHTTLSARGEGKRFREAFSLKTEYQDIEGVYDALEENWINILTINGEGREINVETCWRTSGTYSMAETNRLEIEIELPQAFSQGQLLDALWHGAETIIEALDAFQGSEWDGAHWVGVWDTEGWREELEALLNWENFQGLEGYTHPADLINYSFAPYGVKAEYEKPKTEKTAAVIAADVMENNQHCHPEIYCQFDIQDLADYLWEEADVIW